MKNETQTTDDLRKLGELIEGIEVAMLTTHAADGSMVSRPLQTLEFDTGGELVFFTSVGSRKVEELSENHDVNIAYANPAKQVYVSVRGTARIDRDRATIDALWSPVQKIFFPAGKDDPNARRAARSRARRGVLGIGRQLHRARARLRERHAEQGAARSRQARHAFGRSSGEGATAQTSFRCASQPVRRDRRIIARQ